MDRETLEFDVVFVGAGPGELEQCVAPRTSRQGSQSGTCQRQTNRYAAWVISKLPSLKRAQRWAAHIPWGAVMDPKALKELMPDFTRKRSPL